MQMHNRNWTGSLLTEQSMTEPKVSSAIQLVAWLMAEYVGRGQLAKDLLVRGKCAVGKGKDWSASGSMMPPVCAQTPGVCPASAMTEVMGKLRKKMIL